jgi:hypothetical protein
VALAEIHEMVVEVSRRLVMRRSVGAEAPTGPRTAPPVTAIGGINDLLNRNSNKSIKKGFIAEMNQIPPVEVPPGGIW